jgi:hypothetical protein
MRPPKLAPGTLKWWIVGVIGVGGGIALVVWFGLAATLGKPTWQTVSYKVLDDRTVTVSFDVSRPSGQPLTCLVHALGADFATVGSIEVHVPQADTDTTREQVTVRTTTRAVTGAVQTCMLP